VLPLQLVLRKTAERSFGKKNGSASEIRSTPRLSLRGLISYSRIADFKNQLVQNAVQSRGNLRRFAGRLSVGL